MCSQVSKAPCHSFHPCCVDKPARYRTIDVSIQVTIFTRPIIHETASRIVVTLLKIRQKLGGTTSDLAYILLEFPNGGLESEVTVVFATINEEFEGIKVVRRASGTPVKVRFVCMDSLEEEDRFVNAGKAGLGVGEGMIAVVVIAFTLAMPYSAPKKAIFSLVS